jgi:hypothetical protein
MFIESTPIGIIKVFKDIKKQGIGITDYRQLTHYFLAQKNTPWVIRSIIETRFIAAEKPFFNVYPKVCEALSKTSIEITPSTIPRSVIHELPAISIKLPIKSTEAKIAQANWVIVSVFDKHPHELLKATGLTRFFGCADEPFLAIYHCDTQGVSLSTVPLYSSFKDSDCVNIEGKREEFELLCRIVLGVMLLASDPNYIKPVLLKADENKTTPLNERVERAKKRGVYGFTIGEDIERSPHFRRPHFAVRWTGKGGEIPKLVPVKGAVINKKLMITVPTGYEVIGDE